MAVNILLSFAYHAGTDLAAVKAGLRGQGLLMIDSGAYTAHTTGKTIRLEDYAAYLRTWEGAWDAAVTLDVIGDHAATVRNTRRLHEMGLPVLPVYTFGTPMAELDALAAEFPYICVGGLVAFSGQREKLRTYHAAVRRRAARQGCAVHALGMGSVNSLLAIRPYSSDSSAASSAPSFGGVLCWDGRRLVSVSRKTAAKSAHLLRSYGMHPQIVATGRAWEKGRRISTGAIGFLSVALADEYLKRRYTAPPPPTRIPGPHLYSALAANADLETVQLVAGQITDGTAPPAWSQYAPAGPHLYSSATAEWSVESAMRTVEAVANGDAPPAWNQYQ